MDVFQTGIHGVAHWTECHFTVKKHICWVKEKATGEGTRKVNYKEIN